MTMSVSVVVPMKNAERYIGDCIKSILSCTSNDIELIVVDDKSDDGSRSIVTGFQDSRILIVEGPGTGISDCLNAGVARASRQILMRCDADDIYPPSKITQQLKWLEEHPEFDAVCGAFSTMDEKGRVIIKMPCGNGTREITGELRSGITRTHLSTFAMRAATAKRIEFRRFFKAGEDIDYQLRFSELGRVFYEPIERYRYRIHQNSITHTQSTNQREFYEMMARSTQYERLMGKEDSVDRGKMPPITPKAVGPANTASEHLQGLLLGGAWYEHSKGSKAKALALNWKAIRHRPFDVKSWKSFVALVIK
jgi:glycosyltransferase involved in cell wall biosynthesis